jgi:hypothetical protein
MDDVLHQTLDLRADENEQGQDCFAVKSGDALDRANGASCDKKLNRSSRVVEASVHVRERGRVVFSKSVLALKAAVTLKPLPVFPEFLSAGLAVVTRHFGLPFCGSKPIMDLRSAFAAYSAMLIFCPVGCFQHPAGLFVSSGLLVAPHSAIVKRLPSKAERSTSFASFNQATIGEPLKNGVYEREWIVDALETISPAFERGPNLSRCDLLALGIAVQYRPNKFSPLSLSLDLLTEKISQADFSCLSFHNFNVELISQPCFEGDLLLDFLECFFKGLRHIATSLSHNTMR